MIWGKNVQTDVFICHHNFGISAVQPGPNLNSVCYGNEIAVDTISVTQNGKIGYATTETSCIALGKAIESIVQLSLVSLLLVKGRSSSVGLLMLKPTTFPTKLVKWLLATSGKQS